MTPREIFILNCGARMGLAAASGIAGECRGMDARQIGKVLEVISGDDALCASLAEYARKDIERGHPDPAIYTSMVKLFADLGREAASKRGGR